MPPELHLLRPAWLLALIPLAPLLWWLARRPGAGDAWRGVVDPHLLAHLLERGGRGGRRLPLALLAAGWVLGVLALAGPAWEELPRPVYQTDARRVVALDISLPMNAPDLPPSRLVRARFEVLDLLARAGEGQTALIAYGAEPFVVSPLTRDADTIAAQVPDLTTDLLPVRGPARADLALELAGELLARAGSREGDVILVTGGVTEPGAARAAAEALLGRGFRVSVLGVGTASGAPVPLPDGGFLTDADGAIVLPQLDPEALAGLAAAGGGRYRSAAPDDSDSRALVPEARAGAERLAETSTEAAQWREEGPWLLLAVVLLAAVGFRRGWLSPLLLLVLVLPHPPAGALGWDDLWLRPDQQAARAFAEGRPAEAAEAFRRPDWRAAAEYEAEDYGEALSALKEVAGREAVYNRGNALARLGRLEEAIAEYERVLAEDPGHADARHNRELLRDLLARRQDDPPPEPAPDQEPPPEGEGDGGQSGGEGGDRGGGEDAAGEGGGGAGADQPEGGPPSGEGGQAGGDGGERPAGSGREGEEGDGAEMRGGSAGGPGETDEQSGGAAGGSADASDGAGPAGEPPTAAQGPSAEGGADADGPSQSPAPPGAGPQPGDRPDAQDLLGGGPGGTPTATPGPGATGGGEQDQATEQLLRRVPDDPGGLLRQRFLLQHLRRSGQLP
jgi:Ca-activated chloride channel family protein